jgi:glycosyltransferase involved in cell wall biosynthesis
MKLSFVIPAYNEERYIGDCLNAIVTQKKARHYDIEIIVVNILDKSHKSPSLD